jgi:H+/Cl- antiporter ClcA
MRLTDKPATRAGGALQLIADEGLTFCMLVAVVAATVFAFGFDAPPDIVVAMLAIGAVTAVAESRLHRRR